MDLVQLKIKQVRSRIVQKATAEQYVNKEALNLCSKKDGKTEAPMYVCVCEREKSLGPQNL